MKGIKFIGLMTVTYALGINIIAFANIISFESALVLLSPVGLISCFVCAKIIKSKKKSCGEILPLDNK